MKENLEAIYKEHKQIHKEKHKSKLLHRAGDRSENKDKDKKKCRYCNLLNVKTRSLVNFFIGNLQNYTDLKESQFADLYSIERNQGVYKQDPGLLITIQHSLTPKDFKPKRRLLYLPLITLTKDKGFFRDNAVIHCTKPLQTMPSQDARKLENHTILSKFVPEMEANLDFFESLDQNFPSYFTEVDKKFKAKDQSRKESPSARSPDLDYTSPNEQTSPKNELSFEKKKREKNVYILFVRRKYLRRSLLRKLEHHNTREQFQNFTALLIKEIQIHFNSRESFRSVANVS